MRIPASLGLHLRFYCNDSSDEKVSEGHGPLSEIFTLNCDASATCFPLSGFHCDIQVFQLKGTPLRALFGCRIYLHFSLSKCWGNANALIIIPGTEIAFSRAVPTIWSSSCFVPPL